MNIKPKKREKGDSWTDIEENKLIELYHSTNNLDLAEKFNRSIDSIRSKAQSLDLKKSVWKWTDEEVKYILDKKQYLSYDELANDLGRSKWSIITKFKDLNKKKPTSFNEDEALRIIKEYNLKSSIIHSWRFHGKISLKYTTALNQINDNDLLFIPIVNNEVFNKNKFCEINNIEVIRLHYCFKNNYSVKPQELAEIKNGIVLLRDLAEKSINSLLIQNLDDFKTLVLRKEIHTSIFLNSDKKMNNYLSRWILGGTSKYIYQYINFYKECTQNFLNIFLTKSNRE